jgi:CheY-like chemotaxis protein
MKKESVVVVCDGDAGHFEVIRRGLFRAGVRNEMHHFSDGTETLDYLIAMRDRHREEDRGRECILLLDIGVGNADGIELLEKIKHDDKLSNIPVIVLTAVDERETIERCYDIGCSTYVVKPTESKVFEDTVRKIGLFLSVVELASVD